MLTVTVLQKSYSGARSAERDHQARRHCGTFVFGDGLIRLQTVRYTLQHTS
jgi:hypothetical protein